MNRPEPINERLSDASLERRRRKQARMKGQYLKGPIPMPWLERAAKLRGQALAVGVAIWFRAGITSSRTGLRLSTQVRDRLGVERKSSYRALLALEEAKLIRVVRHRGRLPVIDILDVA